MLQMAERTFLPFKTEMWLFLLGMPVGIGLLNTLLQWAQHNAEMSVSRSVWEVCFDLINGFGGDPTSLPGKLAGVGLSFFAMIMLASFTANLAAFQTASSLGSYVASMAQARDLKLRICVPFSIRKEMEAAYPHNHFVSGLNVAYNDDTLYQDQNCDAMILRDSKLHRLRMG